MFETRRHGGFLLPLAAAILVGEERAMMSNDQLVVINLLSLAAIFFMIRLHQDQRGPPLNWEAASEAFSAGLSWADLVPPGSIDPFLAP